MKPPEKKGNSISTLQIKETFDILSHAIIYYFGNEIYKYLGNVAASFGEGKTKAEIFASSHRFGMFEELNLVFTI